jgi:hypothetical protein
MVDTKTEEQSIKIVMPIQFLSSSSLSHIEEGKHGTGGGVFSSLTWVMPRGKWYGGKRDSDDGSPGKEAV